MRVAQVVTLLSADARFGGPLAVAREQCRGLVQAGHDVTLFVGWDGVADIQEEFEVIQCRVRQLVPAVGLPGLASFDMLRALSKRCVEFDVVHVHLARDLVSAPAARILGRSNPLFLQTHGMILPDKRIRSRVFDAVFTAPLMRRAETVFYLTQDECAALQQVSGQASLKPLRNGLAPAPMRARALRNNPKVLFCARLHPRKRVGAFIEMAGLVSKIRPDAQFLIAGPDDGDLAPVAAAIGARGSVNLAYVGALASDAARQALADADVFVLPSEDEPFPMSVLEALSSGTPSVITDTCGIAVELKREGAALVTDGSPIGLSTAVIELITDPALWEKVSSVAMRTVNGQYSAKAVTDRLTSAYELSRMKGA